MSGKDKKVLVEFKASLIPYLHTILGYSAFAACFLTAYNTKFHQVLKNQWYGWPQEWFPSVSAVTGDYYPARSIFQIFIALTAGPRFGLLLINYVRHYRPGMLSKIILCFGLGRTIAAGCWIYITSSDHHFVHEVGMIVYLVFGLCYMVGLTWVSSTTFGIPIPGKDKDLSDTSHKAWKYRLACILGFLSLVPFLFHFFVQHKVHRVPGAYSYYSCFEWCIIIYDVGFDGISAMELKNVVFQMIETSPSNLRRPRSLGDKSAVAHKRSTAIGGILSNWYSIIPYPGLLDDFANTYLAFTFWSTLTSLPLTIWYFPLWNMGLSGYEAFLFSTLSPCLLGLKSVRWLVWRFPWVFWSASLIGLFSYSQTEATMKLLFVGLGVTFSFLVVVSSFMGGFDGVSAEEKRKSALKSITSFILGLFVSLVAKIYGYSNNPIWSIMNETTGGLNKVGILFGALSCLIIFLKYRVHIPQPIKTLEKTSSPSISPIKKNPANKPLSSSPDLNYDTTSSSTDNWLSRALGFSGIMFLLHAMFTDTSIIVRWSTTGYPHPGPEPLTGGAMTLISMGFGFILSLSSSPNVIAFVHSSFWWCIGTAGVFALYYLPGGMNGRIPFGFIGGLVFAVYVMSIIPSLLLRIGETKNISRTLIVGCLMYDILQLASVWVVAYAFVPGGVYARERTQFIIVIVMFFILLGVRAARPVLQNNHRTGVFSKAIYQLVVVLAIASIFIGGRLNDFRKNPIVPYHPDSRLLTAGIWTVHFGLDEQLLSSHMRMEQILRDLELDVIGLLESDTSRIIMGNRDLTQYLAEKLFMYADYGPAPTTHTWGCSMLSKYPIKKSEHLLLPSPTGELACAIYATLEVYGVDVDVIVSHNGQEEDWPDRKLQTEVLSSVMKKSSENGLGLAQDSPFIFLGYVVSKPGMGHILYRIFMEQSGGILDIDPTDYDRWCQYILYRGLKRTGYARISHGHITDTEIQVGKFRIPLLEQLRTGWWKQIGEERMDEENGDLMFPSKFYGKGVRGHRFHVFNRPKYYD